MTRRAVTNSTCLIALGRINTLDLLPKVFAAILAPPAVSTEFGIALDWLRVQAPSDDALVKALATQLHAGEAEAIALAMELGDATIILDDKKARRIASDLGLRVTGTLGVLVRAKRQGVVPAVKPLLDRLETAGFYTNEPLREKALALAREAD